MTTFQLEMYQNIHLHKLLRSICIQTPDVCLKCCRHLIRPEPIIRADFWSFPSYDLIFFRDSLDSSIALESIFGLHDLYPHVYASAIETLFIR